ncbi:MAG: response regulator [Selenomonadaceae bacterium]|nr:response regulator [Selenomonadaceae bacterium]
MIQETFKINRGVYDAVSVPRQKFQAILDKVKTSADYLNAKSVYCKLLMASVPPHDAREIRRQIREALPKAKVAGMSLTQCPDDVGNSYLRVSFSYFKNSEVTIFAYDGHPGQYAAVGRDFGEQIAAMDNVKAVEIFCVVLGHDIAPFVETVTAGNEDIPFYGSLAGMNQGLNPSEPGEFIYAQSRIRSAISGSTAVECYVMGRGLHESGLVLVVFSGARLSVRVDYLLGWKPLGKEMTVTRAKSATCITTIDGMPATEVYRKYLHVAPDDRFLLNICEFPMIVERDGFSMARTPPLYDEAGRLYFIADLHEGEKIRLSYANPQEVLEETQNAADCMAAFNPQGLFLIICPNREVFFGEDAGKELNFYRRLQPMLVASHGPGEIFRHRGKGGVLNSSLLAVGMRENKGGEIPKEPTVWHHQQRTEQQAIPLTTRLAAFLDATSKELKEMADAADAASIAKSQFLSNMSHEIRTPINAVLGMNEMILRESTDETILEYAENVRVAGSNLLGLVNDILDFSKIESGKLDIIPVEYSLSSLLNDLVNMIQSRVDKKGLTLAVNTAPDLPNFLFGDEIRLKQVVTNILTNAVKYTERGFVALSVTFERTGEDSISLRVSVKDSGIGIKEEDLKKLFNAFERIEEKRNRSIEGTGLGMNITKRLLTMMGSKLKVESTYGKGSTFSFELEQKVINWEPMGNFEEAYHSAFAQRKEYNEKFTAPEARVLVVDDTPMNLTVVKGLLKKTKVQIDTAASGYACLEMAATRRYDIILLDHRMPGMDGMETIKRLKAMENNPNAETPIISLTANAMSGAREEYLAAGFADYLTKPINGQQLEAMLLKYLPENLITSRDGQSEPSEEEQLPEWLTQVSGIDTALGIEHCGSPEAFMESLTVFAEAVMPNAREIAHYFETEDWPNFTTKVHALKSTAAVIGARELSDRARYLEYAGNHNYVDEIKYCADDLLQLYMTYAVKLAPLTKPARSPAEDEDDRPLIDPAELQEAYDTLTEVVAAFDYDSLMFVLDSLAEYKLPPEDASRYQALRDAAKRPDWEQVRELLSL